MIVGSITSNVSSATASTDHVLLDWQAAGLRVPSAFRTYFAMSVQSRVRLIGHVSDLDWQAIQACVRLAFA